MADSMTPEQFEKLLDVLGKLLQNMQHVATRDYTITGSSDWPMLCAIGAILGALVGFMWLDLRGSMRENRQERQKDISDLRQEMKTEDQKIWTAIGHCQDDCCPRREKK